MATVRRAGGHAIVHMGIETESEFKVEVHMSLKVAEELVAANWEPLLDGTDPDGNPEDNPFEVKLGTAVMNKLMLP